MTLLRFEPGAMFGDAVESIWDWCVEPGRSGFDRVLPVPGNGIIFNLAENETRTYDDDALRRCEYASGAVFDGQYTRSFLIDSAEQTAVMGVMFRPGGAAHFFGEPMQRLTNQHLAVDDLAGGNAAAALRERLLHTPEPCHRIELLVHWLRQRYRADALHPVVRFALRRLSVDPSAQRIDALVADSGYSARRFATLFEAATGIGAKR